MKSSIWFVGVGLVTAVAAWAGCSSSSTGTTTTTGATEGTNSTSSGAGASSASSTTGTTGTGASTTTGTAGTGGTGGSAPIDIMCNPVTNSGCTTGQACEPASASASSTQLSGFGCFPGTYTVADCASCDPTGKTQPSCSPGSACFAINQAGTMGQCTHFCCTDADCGTDGACATMNQNNMPIFAPVSSTLGVCITTGDAGASQFACNAPATPPSAGSCITLTP